MALLWNLLTKSVIPQNIASWVYSRYPQSVQHNLQKYQALSKAFYMTAAEKLDGDYLEFGVFTGSSFVLATRAHRQLKALGSIKTKFYGFDSFSGFGNISEDDQHQVYSDDVFKLDQKHINKIKRNILKKSKNCDVNIIEGFFEDTIANKTPENFGIEKARIVFIDCDLKEPANLVFKFITPALQKGMILVMDDFYSYKGDKNLGVSGAFHEFCQNNPHLHFRRLLDFGLGGIAYILSETK